ncbi:hypothetical protein Tco_1531009 [Tanacetum coccineum]
METPLDFSALVLNQLKVDTLTPESLAGPTFELMKGSCKCLVELEYFLEEPLPLIPNSRGRRVIPFDHFINNNLAYLSGGVSSRTYATSVTKTKAADYGHIKWIEDLVPNTMWSQVPIVYDKHALWGISHWGRKHQQFYGFAVNRESARDVYSKNRILAVTKLKIVKWHNYKHLDWITVRRNDDKLYTFKEGDYNRLCLQDIEDMLLFLIQGKLTNLNVKESLALGVSLRMFTRSIILRRRVEDLQLGVTSYQKNLNLTRPDTRSVSIRCQGYIGDFVLGCHAKDMVALCFGKLMCCEPNQILERVYCVLQISGLYTLRLLDAACKKVLNLLKKRIFEAMDFRNLGKKVDANAEELLGQDTDQIKLILKE